jgi:hypothetical protein
MLAVEVPDDIAERFLIADMRLAGRGSRRRGGWREFCIPADVLNRLPRRSLTIR